MKSKPNDTITADRLCSFTGLTDRRHRQLAAAGYFPPPERGKYAMAETITGLFRYFREQAAKVDDLRAAQTRRELAVAKRVERENRLAEGETIDVSTVIAECNRRWINPAISALDACGDRQWVEKVFKPLIQAAFTNPNQP